MRSLWKRRQDEIDLREGAPVVKGFGFPTSCPECGGRGYLDHLDLIDRIQEQHCTACGHKWVQSEAELDITA